jgi:hypothetical protein
MAEKEAIFNLKVNTGNSVNDVKKFDKAVKDVDKSLNKTQKTAKDTKGTDHFAKKLQEMNALLKSGTLTFQQQTKMIKDYQGLALQAGATSPVGKQAIQQAAQLRDTLTDLDNRVKLLSSDYVHLETSMQAISTGAQIFQGMASVTALVGSENEDLMKVMVKLQAVMGVTNSINAVANALNKDSLLGIRLRIIATKLLNWIKGTEAKTTKAVVSANTLDTVSTNVLTASKKTLGKASLFTANSMKILKAAIVSTGIGALIVGLGMLVEKLMSATDETEELAKAQEKLNKQAKIEEGAFQRTVTNDQSLIENDKRKLALLKARGASEKEIFDVKVDVINGEIELLKKIDDLRTKQYLNYTKQNNTTAEEADRLLQISLKAGQDVYNKEAELDILRAEKSRKANEEGEKARAEFRKEREKKEKQARDKFLNNRLLLLKSNLQREIKAEKDIEKIRLEMLKNTNLEHDELKQIELEKEIKAIELKKKFENEKQTIVDNAIKDDIKKLDERFKKGRLRESTYLRKVKELRESGLENMTDEEKALMEFKQKKLHADLLQNEIIFGEKEIQERARREKEKQELFDKTRAVVMDDFEQQRVDLKKSIDEQLKILEEGNKEGVLLEGEYNATREKLAKELADKEKQIAKDKADFIKEQNGKIFEDSVENVTRMLEQAQMGIDQLNALNELANVIGENKLAKIEEDSQAELDILTKKQQQELSNQSLTDEQKKSLEEKFAKQKHQIELKEFNESEKIKKAQFQREKALKVSQIAIETSLAVLKSIANNGGMPLGLPFGIASGVLGATQIATVLAQKYQGGTAPTLASASGGGGGGTAGAGASSFTANTNAQQTNLGDILGGQDSGTPVPSQVYVVESDITNTQDKVAMQEIKTVF